MIIYHTSKTQLMAVCMFTNGNVKLSDYRKYYPKEVKKSLFKDENI